MFLSETLSEFFKEFSFVGFYDAKVGDSQKFTLASTLVTMTSSPVVKLSMAPDSVDFAQS